MKIEKQLGRLPARSDTRALMFARFAEPPAKLPAATKFWDRRTRFPLRSFGNLKYGDCTIAKQAIASMRMERLETKRTPNISDEEVVTTYFDMTNELYGGGDSGAFETDALNNWRDPAKTFKSRNGPMTIDAYTRVNHADQMELRQALWTAGAHGIAICLNLPLAFSNIVPPDPWDIPEGHQPIEDWLPGSWGGHSMFCRDYDAKGIWLCHTWDLPDQLLTWRAAAIYLDEAHVVIDSLDLWRKKPALKKLVDFDGIKKAVNEVSRIKIS